MPAALAAQGTSPAGGTCKANHPGSKGDDPIVWDGPRDGPPGQPGKTVLYIAEDMRNGGISGVFRGLQAATDIFGWQFG